MKSLTLLTVFILSVIALSCKPQKEIDRIALAKDFYKAMNSSDFDRIASLHKDSIRIKEGDYSYASTIKKHLNWLQWDSVFKPTYKILEINELNNEVHLTISKTCRRTLFLNKEPYVTQEILRFKNDKIIELEIVSSVNFDNDQWDANRAKLVSWVDLNHPELNGFIHDQSLNGGLNYLKAIELYEKAASDKIDN